MLKVIKKTGKKVNAYRLGDESPMLKVLIGEGKIILHENGLFEIISQEIHDTQGELARSGDYIKIDSLGFPYPNEAKWFLQNHRKLSDNDEYEQIPKVLWAWTIDEPMCEEIEFLLNNRRLEINKSNLSEFFQAELWGTKETAGVDAIIVFYDIRYDLQEKIVDIDFNFVAKDEFDKTYDILNK